VQSTTKEQIFDRYRLIMDTKVDEWAGAPLACPVSEYSSPERVRDERRVLFRGTPLVVALTADLPAPSTAFSTDVDGVPLLIIRDAEGQSRVFVNACRHRGTKLFEGQSAVAPTLVCPYHAWSYRLDGALHKRPQGEECFSGIARDGLGLRELPSDEAMGVILARLDGVGSVDVKSWMGDLAPELASYGLEGYHHVETRHHDWNFNWKIGLDTFLEAYHIFSLHKRSISKYIASWPLLVQPSGQHMFTFAPWRRMAEQADAADILRDGTVQNVIFPNMLITHQIDHIETWSFYPDGADPSRCKIVTSLYAPREPQSEKESAHWAKNLQMLMDIVTGEDFPQCLAIQHGIDSGAVVDDFVFGQDESGRIWYHQKLKAALEAGRVSGATTERV